MVLSFCFGVIFYLFFESIYISSDKDWQYGIGCVLTFIHSSEIVLPTDRFTERIQEIIRCLFYQSNSSMESVSVQQPPRTIREVFESLPEGTLAQLIENQLVMSPAPGSLQIGRAHV